MTPLTSAKKEKFIELLHELFLLNQTKLDAAFADNQRKNPLLRGLRDVAGIVWMIKWWRERRLAANYSPTPHSS